MTASRYRKKPTEVEAHQWFKNGDHPDDGPADREGRVVRCFRRPEADYAGCDLHHNCLQPWHDHGWIDTLEGGHTVCPGDWIVTGVQGERYPVKPDVFAATYEPIRADVDNEPDPAAPVHACPRPAVDNGIMPCCGRTPFEVRSERLTNDPARVTCRGAAQ